MSETLIVIVSIFGLIGLGYAAARVGLLSAEVGERLAEFVFTLAIPLLLFDTLATADLHGVSPWRIWAAYFIPFAIVWVVAHLAIVHVFGRDQRAGIVAGGAAAYSNTVLVGIPLMQVALGDAGLVFLVVVAVIHLPILMIVSVVLNERALAAGEAPEEGPGPRERWRRLAVSLATHPILICIVLGLLWRATGLTIPRVVASIIDPLAHSAGPLALFVTGMTLVNYGVGRQIGPAFLVAMVKLVLLPALVMGAAWTVGLPPMGIAAVTLVASCPTGVNASLIAIRLGTGQALSSNALLISTAGGVLTVALWLTLIKTLIL